MIDSSGNSLITRTLVLKEELRWQKEAIVNSPSG